MAQHDLKILKELDSGHFGQVLLGEDAVHGEVAVKRLVPAPNETAEGWEERKNTLLSEAQKLKKATHRNVVQIHSIVPDQERDALLMVMELCQQGSLEKQFKEGPISIDYTRSVLTDITQGLQALHARGMLHRDIKPGNILIAADGVAKIGDFGHVTDNLVYGYGSIAGYLDHLAPEVRWGYPTSEASDIWAVGMTVYRLLHGERWYKQVTRPAKSIPEGGYGESLPWLPHIPKEWRRFVRRCLRDKPEDRLKTAGETFTSVSKLPASPAWECQVDANEIRWELKRSRRLEKVSWKQHSPRRHEWYAWSEPVQVGRNRKLEGSDGVIGLKDVRAQLEKFFEAYR